MDAAAKLAERLSSLMNDDSIIIGIPRGGAVIAYWAAIKLNKPWDIIVPRKIGAPSNKEVAIGAVTQDGTCLLNEKLIDYLKIDKEYIDREVKIQREEINRRLREYRDTPHFPDVLNKVVILVDDGIATGFTAAAALNSLKKHTSKKVVLAVPVASKEAIEYLKRYADEVICLEVPENFISVGSYYEKFEQNTDEEVIDLFKQRGVKRLV
jgi:predicted phosphoribosyltransferase